ncbi:interleukin-1 beta-like [Rhinoderma darwinii]|uniref:interleukin-1 beta-like n=1 Tax=Rhinoderma darwinii TaxID=43563 RepID=UPI003F67DFBA
MAEVPELSDLPMDISENDEEFYANDLPSTMKVNKYSHCHEIRYTCLSKIKLDIRKPEKSLHSFKKVLVLATVVEKLKGEFNNQHFFYDNDLLSPVQENITFRAIKDEEAAITRFRYSKTSEHVIRDLNRKSLKLEGNDSIVASFLAGENLDQELKINVDTYLEGKPNKEKLPVTLSIASRKLYFCCAAEGTTNRVLCLTKVDDIKGKVDDDLSPFIFYYRKVDNQHNTFESAEFPGYYISTSQTGGEKLQMKPENDHVFRREFTMTPRLV